MATQAINRLYRFMIGDDGQSACQEISDKACQKVPANFFLILISQLFTKLGDAFASTKIVLPWLMTSLGVPAFIIGMLVPVRESLSMLPQLFIGSFIRGLVIRKWVFVIGCVIQGLAVLMMAWVAWNYSHLSAGLMIMAALIVFSLARGLCSVSSKDVLGKTIPKTQRGRLMGYSASAAGVITVSVGIFLLLGNKLNQQQIPYLLIAAALFWIIASYVYLRLTEYAGDSDEQENVLQQALDSLKLLKTDPAFRSFVIVRCLLMSSGLAAPYLIMLASESAQASGFVSLGLFISTAGVANLMSGVIWGKLADISSRKVLLLCGVATTILCAIAGFLANMPTDINIVHFLLLFFLLAIVHQGVRLGRKTYVVDLAEGNRRTDYVAVSNTLIGVMLLIVGLSGALAAQVSIAMVLKLFALASMLAAVLAIVLPEAS